MSYANGLQTVVVEQFRDQFDIEYQLKQSKIVQSMQIKKGIVGSAWKPPASNFWAMHDRGAPHSLINPTYPEYKQNSMTPNDKVALVPSDIFQQAECNANERTVQARQAAYAIARQETQIAINGLDASTTTNLVPVGTTNLTIEKLRATALFLTKNNVPAENRFYVGHASQQDSLLGEEEASSSDYNTTRVLVNGQIDSFMGFKFIWIGDMAEGGLPKTGDNRTNFAFHMDSIWFGYWSLQRGNPSVEVQWDVNRQSWLIVPKLKAGCVESLPTGIVKIVCDES